MVPLDTKTFKISFKNTILEFHHIIQVVMEWTNSQLYQFNVGQQVNSDTRLMDDELGPGFQRGNGYPYIVPCRKHRNV
jgi:hypothetical protein